MTNKDKAEGSCLCGAVHVVVIKADKNVGVCHCGMCRKWGGGPLIAVDCGTEVNFVGDENISIYNSSAWAERGFCSKCGSHMFYRIKEKMHYSIPAGIFEDSSSFILDHQIFIDKKPDYYNFENKTSNLTEAEVFAKYGVSN